MAHYVMDKSSGQVKPVCPRCRGPHLVVDCPQPPPGSPEYQQAMKAAQGCAGCGDDVPAVAPSEESK